MGAAPTALIGRERELEAAQAALDGAVAGQGSLLLATGEPGIGKTRLLEEVAREAAGRGFAVAWGRAWEAGGAPAYWPWIQILRALRRSVAAEVAGLFPDLSAAGASPSDRFSLYDGVAGALGAAGAASPLLLLLDDLHAADPSSVQLLEFVAGQLVAVPVVVVASYRDVEARLDPALADVIARVGRRGRRLPLARLGQPEVAALVRSAGTLPDDEAVVAMVHAATEGNPLFVGELVRLIAARTGVPPGGRLPVPDGVRAVMRERLRLLGAECVELLAVGAVIGREFRAPLLAAAAEIEAEAPPSRLSRALVVGLVEERAPGHYAFSHALVAETLVADLDPGRRAELHLRVARALERRHADDPAAPLAEIAHHYLEAGAASAGVAVEAAARAAHQAMQGLAFEDAAALLERALATEALVSPPDGERRAELLLALGEACLRAGSSERGRQACREAGELGRAHGSATLTARAALIYGLEFAFAVVDSALVGLLEEALRVLPAEDSALRARVMARLAGALQPAPDPAMPMALAREAIEMVRRVAGADAEVRLDVLHTAGSALVDYAPPEERIALSREVIELADGRRDRPRRLRARLRLIFDHLELGDLRAVGEAVRAYEAAVEEFPQPRYRWPSMLLHALLALLEGRFADAARYAAEAEALGARAGDPNLARALLAHRVIAARSAVRDDEARAAATAHLGALAQTVGSPLPRLHQLWCAVVGGEFPLGLDRDAVLDSFGDGELVALCRDFNFACFLAEVIAERGDRPRAELAYRALLPRAGRVCVATMLGFGVQDLADRALALLATVRQAWDDAERHAAEALALAERLGSPPLAARVRYDRARALLARGRAEDRSEAERLLEASVAVGERLGMPGLVARGREALAPLASDGRPSPAPTPPAWAPGGAVAARREGDTWTVSGGGEVCRLRDSRGVRMLARLLERPGEELHVLDLAGSDGIAVDGGDAGEVLDREARAAYQARLAEIDAELGEAESWNDTGRAERARQERDALRAELSRAVGLGGRERREGRAVERARVNVQRRLADALRRIAESCPGLGRYLDMTVRTGTLCAYEPFRPAGP